MTNNFFSWYKKRKAFSSKFQRIWYSCSFYVFSLLLTFESDQSKYCSLINSIYLTFM